MYAEIVISNTTFPSPDLSKLHFLFCSEVLFVDLNTSKTLSNAIQKQGIKQRILLKIVVKIWKKPCQYFKFDNKKISKIETLASENVYFSGGFSDARICVELKFVLWNLKKWTRHNFSNIVIFFNFFHLPQLIATRNYFRPWFF